MNDAARSETGMTTDAPDERIDVFFYGLYMDPDVLTSKGIPPRNPRKASVPDYALRIGNKATLVRAPGSRATGMVYSLTHDEAHALYPGSGLLDYDPVTLDVDMGPRGHAAVLCYCLRVPPAPEESNPEYERKLLEAKNRLGLT